LRELAALYPQHRLLLFTEGRGLTHPVTGRPSRWIRLFATWSDRALLTPCSAGDLASCNSTLLVIGGIGSMSAAFKPSACGQSRRWLWDCCWPSQALPARFGSRDGCMPVKRGILSSACYAQRLWWRPHRRVDLLLRSHSAGTVTILSCDERRVRQRFCGSRISDLNFLVAPEIQRRTIDVEFSDSPWDQAFEEILKTYGLRLEISGTLVFIVPEGRALPTQEDVLPRAYWLNFFGELLFTVYEFETEDFEVTEEAFFPTPLIQDMTLSEEEVLRRPDLTFPHYKGEPINMSLRNNDLVEVLLAFETIADAIVTIDPDVSGPVTVDVRGVPWDQALLEILRLHNLYLEVNGNAWRVRRRIGPDEPAADG
jgi:hypothetical protein